MPNTKGRSLQRRLRAARTLLREYRAQVVDSHRNPRTDTLPTDVAHEARRFDEAVDAINQVLEGDTP